MLIPRADWKPDPMALKALRVVGSVAEDLGLEWIVAGATARDIMMTGIHGIEVGRATRDVDVAVLVKDWSQFKVVRQRLIDQGGFRSSDKTIHRLVHGEGAFGYPVDVVPFGDVEIPGRKIAWPPDMETVMNVAGFADAQQSAALVQISADVAVPVVSLPGLAILKLFAWQDRRGASDKDAIDLANLMKRYDRAGNEDRLYGEHFQIVEDADFDPEIAGARLLGMDVRATASQETLEAVLALVDTDRERLIRDLEAHVRGTEDSNEHTTKLVDHFLIGLRD